ncbi:hypothetical protein BaRGS_00030469, partial [Batillaria attramentaria]
TVDKSRLDLTLARLFTTETNFKASQPERNFQADRLLDVTATRSRDCATKFRLRIFDCSQSNANFRPAVQISDMKCQFSGLPVQNVGTDRKELGQTVQRSGGRYQGIVPKRKIGTKAGFNEDRSSV